ncbi:MAG: hypothetical protein U5L75_02580 [Candidatus Campbellbacteria bacterium]|nr:hypothetical protein [Candidatus Campbellbacteria bacterium]
MNGNAFNARNIMKAILLIAIASGVASYAYYQSQPLMAGPEIAFSDPENGDVIKESPIEITGTAERISFIKLNGRQIYINESGVFEEKLPLLPGHNIIELQAEDRFGRVTTKRLNLMYEGE